MDQCTHEVRAEYWKNIIKACGQSVKKWMDENGISMDRIHLKKGQKRGRSERVPAGRKFP